jgi:hypothetical protein
MSTSYDIGFREKPDVNELDEFMKSLGFTLKIKADSRYYSYLGEDSPREIEFSFSGLDKDFGVFFGDRANEVVAYGNLSTPSILPTYPKEEDRLRIIEEKGVNNEHDYHRYLEPKRLKYYEIALALKNHYNAIVLAQETGKEIDPSRKFPDRS